MDKTTGPAAKPAADTMALEPSDAELDAWAEQERKRREAWLKGPTADERAAHARRVRERRLIELEGEDFISDWARQMVHYPREVQLAMEGAMSLFVRWTRQSFDELTKAGRDWEREFGHTTRRRRVPLDDDRS